jgi:tape measure domain-containing protein
MAEKATVRITATDDTSRAFQSVRQSLSVLQGQARTVGSAFSTLTAGVRAFGGAIVGGLAVRSIVAISDAYKNVDSQLANAVRTANELATAQSRIFEIAQRTRQSYTSLATTYAQISRTAGSSIGTQDQQLQFFDTLSKLVALSGASAEQASNSLTQLRQGLAAGALRGEEFNSVMEGTSRVGYAIAEGLGVSIGQLRKMAADGELSAERIAFAFSNVAATVDEEFKKIVPTVESSLTQLGNSFGRLINRVEKETGGPLLEIGRAISFVAEQLDKLSAVPKIGERISELNEQIAKYERAGDSNQFAAAQAAKLRAERDKLLRQSAQQFKEGERATEQVEFDQRQSAVIRAKIAWDALAKTYSTNAERAARAAEEIRKAGEAAGKSEADIRKLVAASNARFAGAGAKKSAGVFSDPLFDVIAASESRESDRVYRAEQAFKLQLELEQKAARFEESETERLRKIAEGWRDATDATREFTRQYEEVMDAVALGPQQGGLSESEGALARFLLGNEADGVFAGLTRVRTELDELTLQAARNIQDALGQGLYDILDGNFESIGKSFGGMLKRMIAEAAAANLARTLLGNFAKTGEVGGALGGALSFLFGGKRAAGGPVAGGTAYLVGEKGPEMFVPRSNGYIVPNGAAGLTVAPQITINGEMTRGQEARLMTMMRNVAVATMADQRRRSMA